MPFEDLLSNLPLLGGLLLTAFSIWTAGHALIRKRSPRSAAAWVGVCLMFPAVGASLYWLLGQNRIFRRAQKLQDRFPTREELDSASKVEAELLQEVARSERELESLLAMARTGDAATTYPLTAGNHLEPLRNGEEAYPAMLEAIANATETVDIATYLFDGSRTIDDFTRALRDARTRGVEVRVLLDGLGDLIGRATARRNLEHAGITVARFLPPSISERGLHINLRNHRKLLIVDGRVAFTGGMNLRDVHEDVRQPAGAWRARDLHFRVRGPVAAHLERVFDEDWAFSTRTSIVDRPSRAEIAAGDARARVIPDGPDADRDALKWCVIGAINAARHSVRLQTPYFIPPEELEAALISANLRGVVVRIMLPGTTDHHFAHWAARAMVGDILRRGVEIRLQPAPFVHTKLLVIDDAYSLVGSANMDPRSLRLNFELGLSVYDRDLARDLATHFDTDWSISKDLTHTSLSTAPLWRRIRNNCARLAAPYL